MAELKRGRAVIAMDALVTRGWPTGNGQVFRAPQLPQPLGSADHLTESLKLRSRLKLFDCIDSEAA